MTHVEPVFGNSSFTNINNTKVITGKVIKALKDVEPFADITRHKVKIVLPAGDSGLGATGYHFWDSDSEIPIGTSSSSYTTAVIPDNLPTKMRPQDRVLYSNIKVSGDPMLAGATGLRIVDMDPTTVSTTQTVTLQNLGVINVNPAQGVYGGIDALSGKSASTVVSPNLSFGLFPDGTLVPTATTNTLITADIITISVP